MTQGTMPLRDNALSYFWSGYSSKKLGELREETKEYMDSEFPEANWSQIVGKLEPPKPSEVQGKVKGFVKRTSNSADDSAEPAA